MDLNDDLFGGIKLADFTREQKIAELEREIKLRKRVYPRWVEQGKLKADTADIRIKCLMAILKDYRAA